MFRSAPVLFLAGMALVLTLPRAAAQCGLEALPGDPLRHLQGNVDALVQWDPDGAGGPLPLHLVAGGTFDAGTARNEHVVLWDGTAWTPTGATFGHVTSMTTWNGLLVAAADDAIWTFNGTAWSVLASVEEGSIAAPLPGAVNTMILWNGDLVVGGRFTRVVSPFAPATSAYLVARLSAATGWSAVGQGPTTTGMTGANVRAAAIFNNTLWVGLGFASNFSATATLQNYASSWLPYAGAQALDTIDAMATRIATTLTNSYLFVASHTSTGAVVITGFNPALGTGTSIGTPPGAASATRCDQLFVRSTGISSYEVACTLSKTGADKVWRWTAAGGWSALPNLTDTAGSITSTRVHYFSGAWVAGLHGASSAAVGLRRLDAAAGQWLAVVGPGFDSYVTTVCDDGAELVIGGAFTNVGGALANRIARGHAGAWAPLGPGFGTGTVYAVVRLPNGDLVAGGSFTALGDGTPVARIARWNGTTWSALGAGFDGDVQALLVLPNGDLVAAGKFLTSGALALNHLARWNGSSWSSLGGGCNSWVYALASMVNGDLVVGGTFTTAGGQPATRVARWNGTSWSAFGPGLSNAVWALAETSEGLVAGGEFLNSGGVPMQYAVKWNGSAWQPLDATSSPTQPIVALAALPGGGVAVGGAQFSVTVGGAPVSTCVATWRGGWQSLDVRGFGAGALLMGGDGELAVAGDFWRVGSTISVNVATIVSTCPATAATHAAGCPSSGGSNTLSAVSLPWVNDTFRAEATGLPANALVLTLTSVTPVTPGFPLAALFAEGVPGCDLLVAPDILGVTIAVGGMASSGFHLTDTPPIVGVTFYHQMITIEFDPGTGAWVAITATNALRLVGGVF